mmetsp:Transcript_3494/g.9375  ORF Transcript_3494/g.9375 Transcript_3494/m.9375 type:complete len:297 (+) Transcript_3494:196-1086(+)
MLDVPAKAGARPPRLHGRVVLEEAGRDDALHGLPRGVEGLVGPGIDPLPFVVTERNAVRHEVVLGRQDDRQAHREARQVGPAVLCVHLGQERLKRDQVLGFPPVALREGAFFQVPILPVRDGAHLERCALGQHHHVPIRSASLLLVSLEDETVHQVGRELRNQPGREVPEVCGSASAEEGASRDDADEAPEQLRRELSPQGVRPSRHRVEGAPIGARPQPGRLPIPSHPVLDRLGATAAGAVGLLASPELVANLQLKVSVEVDLLERNHLPIGAAQLRERLPPRLLALAALLRLTS